MTQPIRVGSDDVNPRCPPDLSPPRPLQRTPVAGILGGIASGKSLVAEQFAKLGAVVIDGDRLGHAVLNEASVRSKLLDRWGAQIQSASGELDRSAIAKLVFNFDRAPHPESPNSELQFLEHITHPRIGARIAESIAQAVQQGAPLVVLDAPLMMKAGWDKLCDYVIFVDAPQEVRLRRAQLRGWTKAEFTTRESLQTPMAQKRQRASVIIDNSASLEETLLQVNRLWETITHSYR